MDPETIKPMNENEISRLAQEAAAADPTIDPDEYSDAIAYAIGLYENR